MCLNVVVSRYLAMDVLADSHIQAFFRWQTTIFSFITYIATRGTIRIIEYDTLHEIWILTKSSKP
jgi:hypothetical protein